MWNAFRNRVGDHDRVIINIDRPAATPGSKRRQIDSDHRTLHVHNHAIEPHNLILNAEQLIAERGKAGAGNLGHPFVAWVGHNLEQFSNSFAPDRSAKRT